MIVAGVLTSRREVEWHPFEGYVRKLSRDVVRCIQAFEGGGEEFRQKSIADMNVSHRESQRAHGRHRFVEFIEHLPRRRGRGSGRRCRHALRLVD